MRTMLMLVVLLGAVGALAANEPCESGQYTRWGECCLTCPQGEGMVKPCGLSQTVCSLCMDSETYSDVSSHTEPCKPCFECTGLMRMLTPCTDTNNAVCVCDYGYYLDEVSDRCKPCTVCPKGKGVMMRCEIDHDTICEECVDDTFSDQDSSLDPCLPCTLCEEGVETEIKACTPMSDSVCHNPNFIPPTLDAFLPFTDGILPSSPNELSLKTTEPIEDATTPNPGSPRFIGQGLNENLIPIYCSVLAAVVLGLVAYIIFKRWNSCKQNKQGANNRAVNQTASSEGEKLHSDSGISVDTQSLQDQQGQQPPQTQSQAEIVVSVDGGPVVALPLYVSEELERLLGSNGGPEEEGDWSSLASLLGYKEEHIASFRQEEQPVRALLAHWAGKDSASLQALCAALHKMDRDDIAQKLAHLHVADPTATSAV